MGSNAGLWIIGILAALVLISSVVTLYDVMKTPTQVPVDQTKLASDIAKQIVVPAAPSPNMTQVTDAIKALPENKDQAFKDTVLQLASDEWGRNDNRVIFNFIDDHYGNIFEKSDITSVSVEDETASHVNVDLQNAKVVQDLKVKYEKSDGSNGKVYLTVTTHIKDGDVDTQSISIT